MQGEDTRVRMAGATHRTITERDNPVEPAGKQTVECEGIARNGTALKHARGELLQRVATSDATTDTMTN
jgi:hypothetical protein